MNICAQPHNKLTLLMTPTIDSKSEHANQNDKKTKKHAAQMNRVMDFTPERRDEYVCD